MEISVLCRKKEAAKIRKVFIATIDQNKKVKAGRSKDRVGVHFVRPDNVDEIILL